MILKNFSKLKPAPDTMETALQKRLRRGLGMALIIAVCLVYWNSSKNLMQQLSPATLPIADKTGTLASDQLEKLEQFRVRFEQTYGVPLMIHVYKSGTAEECMPEAVCIRLFPAKKQSDFQAPRLVESLLGKDLTYSLQYTHFIPYFERGNWPEGLAEALNKMTERLDTALAPRP